MKLKIAPNGRIVIPLTLRKLLGIENDKEVYVTLDGDKLIITKGK